MQLHQFVNRLFSALYAILFFIKSPELKVKTRNNENMDNNSVLKLLCGLNNNSLKYLIEQTKLAINDSFFNGPIDPNEKMTSDQLSRILDDDIEEEAKRAAYINGKWVSESSASDNKITDDFIIEIPDDNSRSKNKPVLINRKEYDTQIKMDFSGEGRMVDLLDYE